MAQALSGVLPERPLDGQPILNRAINTNIFSRFGRFFGNIFASPITTLPEWRPELRNIARVSRFFETRQAKINSELQNLVARNMAQFNYEQYATMDRRLLESSVNRQPFNRDGLTPEMIAKMEDIQQAHQRALDAYIEAVAIKYFDPVEAKTPADQARLLALWEQNRGRRLLQIPATELQAASPAGYDVIQRYEAVRNPYYFVTTTNGATHFIAAYPKGPDGKRKTGSRPLKMIPVNPTPPRLRRSGAPDPVALAYEEMDSLGFDRQQYYVTPQPVEFTRDAEMAQVRDSADFLAGFVEKLLNVSGNNAETQNILKSMMTSLDKADVERIMRPNQNILHPITKQNEVSYLLTAVPQYLAGMAKLQARKYTDHSFQRAARELSPADQKYWNTLRDYYSAPAEASWIAAGRSLNYHYFMGFAIDSALLDSTQYFTGTLPLLYKDGGAQGRSIANNTFGQVITKFGTKPKEAFGRDTQKFISNLAGQLANNPDEARAIREAATSGVFDPIHTTEIGGISNVDIRESLIARGVKNPERWQRATDTLLNLSGAPKRVAETANRVTAFLAAYRLATQRPEVIAKVNQEEGQGFTNAYQYAVNRVDESQTIASAVDRPYFMRAFPGAELVTQFMSFAHKMTELWLTQGRQVIAGLMRQDPTLAKAGAFGLLLVSMPMVLFAGIWGLPFFETLREAAEALIKLVWKDVRNLDDELREATGDGFWAKLLTRGLPHATGLAATGPRMGIDPIPIEEITNWTPLQILGPIGGSAVDMVTNFHGYASRGDWLNAWASIAPRAAGNAMRGANLAYGTQEYQTPRGNVIVSREQIEQIDNNNLVPVAVRQALGLQSPAIADLREAYRVAREVQGQNRDYVNSLNTRLARAEADRVRATREGNAEAARAAIAEYQRLVADNFARNERFRLSGEEDKMHQINNSAIARRAREMVYGVTAPEVMGASGRPAMRGELQEIQRRYAPQPN